MKLHTFIAATLIVTLSFQLLIPLAYAQGVEAPAPSPTTKKKIYIPVARGIVIEHMGEDSSLQVKDYLSSTRLLIKAGGGVEAEQYYPYGDSAQNNSISSDRQFTSHRKLDGLDVYHAGGRFYAPKMGVFLQADPKEGPQRYSYVGNNPISFNDPTGYRMDPGYTDGGRGDDPFVHNTEPMAHMGQSLDYVLSDFGGARSKDVGTVGVSGNTNPTLRHDPRGVSDNERCIAQKGAWDCMKGITAFGAALLAVPVVMVAAPAMLGVSNRVGINILKTFVTKRATDFSVGFVTSGILDMAMQKASNPYEAIDWKEAGEMATVGGTSQMLAWGILDPKVVGATRVGSFAGVGGLLGLGGRALPHIPAITTDSMIMTTYLTSKDSNLDPGSEFKSQFGTQGGIQAVIHGFNIGPGKVFAVLGAAMLAVLGANLYTDEK